MSYCRWSSMNWRCDVYVYEHVGGYWATHVAGNKTIFPPIPHWWVPTAWTASREKSKWHALRFKVACRVSGWTDRLNLWSLDKIPRRSIRKAHAGESFDDPTPGDCANRLEMLLGLGYTVPNCVIAALRAEQAELLDREVEHG